MRCMTALYENTKELDEEKLKLYCRDRDIGLRNELAERYFYIAEILAKKFLYRGVEYDDLLQVASLALIKALERFECDKGYKFSSYATPTIIGEIKNYFRDSTRTLRISRRDSEMIKRMENAKAALSAHLGRAPLPREVAGGMELPVEKVLELMEKQSASYTISLEKFIDSDEETELFEVLGVTEKEYVRIEDSQFLRKSFESMTEIEKKVIRLRFAKGMSQRKAAHMLGVSQMYVSRLEKKIVEKFRRNMDKV
ncbi:MAG: sigma-70 family RNA polymerase sigma factor [Bacillota bacterium]|nr:sigma-70 family RNA polymerase sigma factor [Bacillota bacterium]